MSHGGARKTAGRKPGVKNTVPNEIKEAIKKSLIPYLEDLPTLFQGLQPQEKVDAILQLLPYVCAKSAPEQPAKDTGLDDQQTDIWLEENN